MRTNLSSTALEQKLEVKQVEIDNLLEERERAQNELQKLKDIIGAVDNPDDYRKRQSYLPDCSSQVCMPKEPYERNPLHSKETY
jgi:hypothetical protein